MGVYPISYFVVIGIIMAGVVWAIQRIRDGTGIPMLAVIATVAVWYVGDAFYNDYANSYYKIFDDDVLQNAWWEVAWFLVVFLVAVPFMHQWFNAGYLRNESGVLQLSRLGTVQPFLQKQLDVLFKACLIIYGILSLIAAVRLKGEIPYFFFPFLGYKAEPWGRERIGTGFDALLSFAQYVQLIVATVFGILAGVSHNPRTRFWSIVLCFVSWPYFLFDRTRNTILAVVIPGIFSWVFLRLRYGIWAKILVLAGCFLVLNGWMAFIIENRSYESIASAFSEKGFNLEEESKVHHQGLNMFEELCWINTFIKKGTFEPDWGTRYFAELVNPIPRALWHGKPMIGIDYAVARGMGAQAGAAASSGGQANVYATISTGLIGQGVVNFGGILGPAAAALLMSFWVAVLARQDLQIWNLGRLPLYALGIILTFNMGRDITFITLYPFVFLLVALWWLERRRRHMTGMSPEMAQAGTNLPGGQAAQQPVHKTADRRHKVVVRSAPPPKRVVRSRPDNFPPQ